MNLIKETTAKSYQPHLGIKRNGTNGFSLIEVFIVVAIIGILCAISVPYFLNYNKLYKSDNQARIIMDLMAEAGQRAMTRRRTFRFELDLTANKALIIDENNLGTADDTEIKAINLESVSNVRFDRKPNGVSKPNPPNYNDAVFAKDSIGHLEGTKRVSGNRVWAVRFQRDGTVVNSTGNLTSANLYVWIPLSPGSNLPSKKQLVRCITLVGTSGAVRYWKHSGSTFVPYQ